MKRIGKIAMVIAAAAWTGLLGGSAWAADETGGDVRTLNPNGGWCWFQDERVLVDKGRIVFGSVSSPGGLIQVTTYDMASGKSNVVTLNAGYENDDHNTPALLVLPDGRYLAAYSRHGRDSLMRWRVSARPRDATLWGPEKSTDAGARVTYSNLFRLEAENGRLYNFHRGRGFDPNYIFSDDGGVSWSYGGRLLANADDPKNRKRPYLKYASNHVDAIHFVATEDHPQHAPATSIYHGYFKAGKVYRSDGTELKDLRGGGADPTRLTRVFAGDGANKAWTSDLQLDPDGRPYLVYSVHKNSGDHRYRYARWDGAKWRDAQIAHAGRRLYPGEEHYTGNAALDPNDPDVVYISTDADPSTGRPLISGADGRRHYEIFKGAATNGGATWEWSALTEDSASDNIRPLVPEWNASQTAVLWLRGVYRKYTDYDLEVVGVLFRRE